MTLGRTSSGAIKIKTDEAGGGLRAVNCGCCGGCDGCLPYDLSVFNACFLDPSGMPPSSYYPPNGFVQFDVCGGAWYFDQNSDYSFGGITLYRNLCGVILDITLFDGTYSAPCEGGGAVGVDCFAQIFIPHKENGDVDVDAIIGTRTIPVSGGSQHCCNVEPIYWYNPNACPDPYTRTVTIQIQ